MDRNQAKENALKQEIKDRERIVLDCEEKEKTVLHLEKVNNQLKQQLEVTSQERTQYYEHVQHLESSLNEWKLQVQQLSKVKAELEEDNTSLRANLALLQRNSQNLEDLLNQAKRDSKKELEQSNLKLIEIGKVKEQLVHEKTKLDAELSQTRKQISELKTLLTEQQIKNASLSEKHKKSEDNLINSLNEANGRIKQLQDQMENEKVKNWIPIIDHSRL